MAVTVKNIAPAKQIELKIQLEEKAKPEIKKIFRKTEKEFGKAVVESGGIPRARNQIPVWKPFLYKHYKRVHGKFTNAIKLVGNIQEEDEKKRKEEMLLFALAEWQEQNANAAAGEIAKTTRTNMSEALDQARKNFRAEGRFPSRRELAVAAIRILRKKFSARVENIAATETQKAAESAKFTKMEVESRPARGKPVPFQMFKVWWTRLDNRVRPAHHKVHGQVRPLNKPFDVRWMERVEKLKVPGDMSLGASMGNVAECRCVALYKTSSQLRRKAFKMAA